MDGLLGKEAHKLVADGTLGENLYSAAQVLSTAGEKIQHISCELVVKRTGIGAGGADPVIFNKKNFTFRIADYIYTGLVAASIRQHGTKDTLGAKPFQNRSGSVVFKTYDGCPSAADNTDFLRA